MKNKCKHEWRDTSHYVETSNEEYECPYSGVTLCDSQGYTQYEKTCLYCGEIEQGNLTILYENRIHNNSEE